MSEYKEINTKPGEESIVVEIELDDVVGVDPDKELIVDLGEEDQEIQRPVENPPVKQTTEEDKINKRKQIIEKKDKKRLRQLSSENIDLQNRLNEAEEERQALLEKLNSVNSTNNKAMGEALEQSIRVLSKRMAEAISEGNVEEAVTLQEQIFNARDQLKEVKSSPSPAQAQEPKRTVKKETKAQYEIPEKALDWIDEHPEFKTDEVFHTLSVAISNKLVQEGFDDQSDDFYEELDTRLGRRFPEYFGTEQAPPVKKEQQKAQTVSNSARVPVSGLNQQRKNKNSVVLTPDMIRQADKWGLSLEQMARRVAYSDKHKTDDGYVPIIMPK